jgi:hypothetical protein
MIERSDTTNPQSKTQLAATTCPGEVLTKMEAYEAKAGTLNLEPRTSNMEV